MRGNGNHSYADYQEDDITLEIRPGNTCNFACQTCWPEASSRVAQYHSQAGLIDIQNLDSSRYTNFDFLLPVADRIRDVVLLGGEPFYDKACLAFLSWANKNLTSHLMVFTNGSVVDFEFLKTYPGKISLIFSIDAVGRAAEYVRYGTVWEEVLNNYLQAKELDNVDVRVNITLSVYNYNLIEQVVDLLCESWPGVVSFGVPHQAYLKEISIPLELRPELIENLNQAISVLQNTDIHKDQKTNAVNALTSTVNNLKQLDFDLDSYKKLITFIKTMDQVKGINAGDYSDFLSKLLQYKLS
jgi:sulfatase maturation enzyme AslB (radical SAM superfamily)